jgi:hypothetical protein
MPIEFDESRCIDDYLKIRAWMAENPPVTGAGIDDVCKSMENALVEAYDTLANEFKRERDTRAEVLAMAERFEKYMKKQQEMTTPRQDIPENMEEGAKT